LGEIINEEMRLNSIGEIVREEWMKTPSIRPEIELDDFVVMPNHVHGILIIGETVGATGSVAHKENHGQQAWASPRLAPTRTVVSCSLGAVLGQFKSKTAKRINMMRGTKGVSLWQRNFHDHIIRNDADLNRIRIYIANNPLQWALDEENPDNIKPNQV
jgi:REP element-mobilizing transposase RayT